MNGTEQSDSPIVPRKLAIGIGGHLAMPPLPHHRAYGSVPRRFDWVKLGRRRGESGQTEGVEIVVAQGLVSRHAPEPRR